MSWLKFDTTTPEKPEVLAITIELGWDDPDLTVGKLLKVWRWFDAHSIDGNATSVTPALLDRIVGVTGIANAMENVGWLEQIEGGGLSIPRFENHNGKTAKDRALTAKRVASHRVESSCNAPSVTSALAREEKIREEIKEPKGSTSTTFPPCPHENLLSLFAEHCPSLPQPRIELWKTGKNGKAMRDRWIWVLTAKKSNGDPYASNSFEALAWFGRYFGYIAKSDFLMGVGADWSADLGWLVNRSNFEKVLQGNYENKDKK